MMWNISKEKNPCKNEIKSSFHNTLQKNIKKNAFQSLFYSQKNRVTFTTVPRVPFVRFYS